MKWHQAAVGLALTIVAGQAGAADYTPPRTAAETLRAAAFAFGEGDCAKTTSLVAPLLQADPTISGPERANAYDLAIACALKDQKTAIAGEYARRATALPDSTDYAWRILLATDLLGERSADAIDTVERMARGHGAALNGVPTTWLWQLRRNFVHAHDQANEIRLLKILSDPAYDPDDLQAKVENLSDFARAAYARKLLAIGKRDEARAKLLGIKGFDALSEVVFDPGLAALYGAQVDLRAAVEDDLERHRALVARYPRLLGAINAVAFDLRRLGRDDEAIVLLTATLPKVDQDGAFDDRAETLPWFWNRLAYAYEATGRYDPMVAAFEKGAAVPENGMTTNVSQVINLASKQVSFGRPTEALATLARMGDKPAVSPFGMMQIRSVRGCAQMALGQRDKARAELAAAIAASDDDPATITTLRMCVGDEDGAAASYITRIDDPETRRRAMLELASYDARDRRAPIGPIEAVLDRVRMRPDVVAAMRRVGGPFRFHLQRDAF